MIVMTIIKKLIKKLIKKSEKKNSTIKQEKSDNSKLKLQKMI